MLPTFPEVGLLVLSFAVPFVLVVLTMPQYLKYLIARGRVVDDVHKQPPTGVPSPAGPILFLGMAAGEVAVLALFGSMVPLATLGVAAIAFAVGLTDDLFVLGGKAKPLVLLLAALPLVFLVMVQGDLYEPSLVFPILGASSEHFFIYTVLLVVAVPIVSNAFNMMDSFNGQISWFTILASLALVFGITLRMLSASTFSIARLASALPLLAVAGAFLVFNRFPSRAFDGDSGSLLLGASFASLTVTGGVEIAAIIAIVPAILNSFYILSSLRGFVERRKMGSRPTYTGDDGRLYASKDRSAPVTLARMLLLSGPMTEKELVKSIVLLAAVACLLSVLTSVMTWVF